VAVHDESPEAAAKEPRLRGIFIEKMNNPPAGSIGMAGEGFN